MDNGWIKLHRKLLDSSDWQLSTIEQKVVLITLLLLANHKEKEWEWKGNKFNLKPGQFITSLKSLAKHCGMGMSTQNIRTALKRFEKLNFLTNESTKTGRMITITNWETYQSLELPTNKAANKELTKSQQRANKELTPNKNEKNEKNEKKTNRVILPEWIDPEIWKEFKKYRSNGKNKFTEHAQKLAINKLDKLRQSGNNPNDVINQTIECGWSGLFELRKQKEESVEEWIKRNSQT